MIDINQKIQNQDFFFYLVNFKGLICRKGTLGQYSKLSVGDSDGKPNLHYVIIQYFSLVFLF